MGTAIVMLGVLGLISVLTTTKEGRAEASRKLARWNPLFILLIILQIGLILWPWPAYVP